MMTGRVVLSYLLCNDSPGDGSYCQVGLTSTAIRLDRDQNNLLHTCLEDF